MVYLNPTSSRNMAEKVMIIEIWNPCKGQVIGDLKVDYVLVQSIVWTSK